MRKLTTELYFDLSGPADQIENQLKERLPKKYDLYKGLLSDPWTLKNNQYKHSLYLSYRSEENKILTERRKRFLINPRLLIGLIALFITRALIDYLGIEFEKSWMPGILGMIAYAIFYFLYDPVLNRINPQRETKMQEAHQEIVAIVKSLQPKNENNYESTNH